LAWREALILRRHSTIAVVGAEALPSLLNAARVLIDSDRR
jgi:hypothetical protein